MFFYRENPTAAFSPTPNVYWKCDTINAGQSPDYFNSFPLTATNVSVGTTAKVSNSLQLRYNDSYFLTADTSIIPSSNSHTISIWFYFTNLSSAYPTIFAKDTPTRDYTLLISRYSSTNGNLRFYVRSGGYMDLGNVISNTWYNAVIVWNGINNIKIYINGSLINEDTSTGPYNGETFKLGNGYSGFGDRRWDGFIDEVAIWNSVLDATKIAEIYSFGNTGKSLL